MTAHPDDVLVVQVCKLCHKNTTQARAHFGFTFELLQVVRMLDHIAHAL